MLIDAPFHEGELFVQRRANEAKIAQRNGGVIADTIMQGALRFIEQQSLVVFGSLDKDGQVWASVLVGEPGFVSAPDERTVALDTTQARSAEDDPFWVNIRTNTAVGMLVIELATRRRLRINGEIRHLDDGRFEIGVRQSYPNCPKYIQRRHLAQLAEPIGRQTVVSRRGTGLGDDQRALIAAADTFFVASARPGHGVDASHRGGRPGFVHVLNEQRIRVPDYPGNSMFNTLGNFTTYPYAGMVFVDFDSSRVLQLTGCAQLLWDQQDPEDESGGTQRFWELEVVQWVETRLPRQMRWELLDYSPYNPQPGRGSSRESATIRLTVAEILQKTDSIRSFRLRAADGSDLPSFTAGAHLPIGVRLADGTRDTRHYSILSNPSDRDHYDIAVLFEPEGRGGSQYMHQQVKVGDTIAVERPRNDFPLASEARHSVLIAGGIGITPILSMLRVLVSDHLSVEVHYAARSLLQMAYGEEVEVLTCGQARCYFSEGPTAARLNLNELLQTPRPGTHVYVCGPVHMIESVRDISEKHGWPREQIHFESFGARSIAKDREFTVRLAKSGRSFVVSKSRTILDVLEAADVHVPYDCRRGECRMCVTTVLEGQPEHRDVCLTGDERKQVMCLCVSRANDGDLVLDL